MTDIGYTITYEWSKKATKELTWALTKWFFFAVILVLGMAIYFITAGVIEHFDREALIMGISSLGIVLMLVFVIIARYRSLYMLLVKPLQNVAGEQRRILLLTDSTLELIDIEKDISMRCRLDEITKMYKTKSAIMIVFGRTRMVMCPRDKRIEEAIVPYRATLPDKKK